MVRITNTDKPALSTNASNTKRPRFYLFIYLLVYPSLYASLTACPAFHLSTSLSVKVRARTGEQNGCHGRQILKLPLFWGGVFFSFW
jgi:hypothetical protein